MSCLLSIATCLSDLRMGMGQKAAVVTMGGVARVRTRRNLRLIR